jgi:hypothetical protein
VIFDGVFVLRVEQDALVATAEAESSEWRFEFFHSAVAAGKVMIDAIKNLDGRVALNGTKIGACLRRSAKPSTEK